MAGILKTEIADRLIWHLLDRIRHHPGSNQIVRFLKFSFKDQPPGFRQSPQRLAIIGIVWSSRVKRVLIQLKAFGGDAAKDHRTQTPVSDRRRLDPLRGRLVIPKHEVSADGILAIERLLLCRHQSLGHKRKCDAQSGRLFQKFSTLDLFGFHDAPRDDAPGWA